VSAGKLSARATAMGALLLSRVGPKWKAAAHMNRACIILTKRHRTRSDSLLSQVRQHVEKACLWQHNWNLICLVKKNLTSGDDTKSVLRCSAVTTGFQKQTNFGTTGMTPTFLALVTEHEGTWQSVIFASFPVLDLSTSEILTWLAYVNC
jgi:hypothetical protein